MIFQRQATQHRRIARGTNRHRLFSGELSGRAYGGSDGRGEAFSPDSRLVATAGADGVARVWELQTGSLKLELKGHTSSVNDVNFSPDGRYIATAGEDTTAKLWDATTGRHTASLSGHISPVYSAQFSPDGKYIVTISADHTARLYLVNIEDLMALAQSRVTRMLTCQERKTYLNEELDCGQATPTPSPSS